MRQRASPLQSDRRSSLICWAYERDTESAAQRILDQAILDAILGVARGDHRLVQETPLRLRQASIRGRLQDLRDTHGLSRPAASLQWLDEYEGIVPGEPDKSPYERVERPVRLASGASLMAWVYLYRRSVRMRPEVPGGSWVPPQV